MTPDLPTRKDPSGELSVSERDDLPPYAGGVGHLLHTARYASSRALDCACHRARIAPDLRRRSGGLRSQGAIRAWGARALPGADRVGARGWGVVFPRHRWHRRLVAGANDAN